MSERRRHGDVDAALDAARRAAASTRLPPALRARILAATRPAEAPAPAPAPRTRVIDFVLRGAAVAASIAAVVLVAPLRLSAAEFDANPLAALNERLTTSVAERLPRLDLGTSALPGAAEDAALPLAAAAAVLVGAGLVAVRRGARS